MGARTWSSFESTRFLRAREPKRSGVRRGTPRLNMKYVVFGKVISGMDVVDKLKYADRIVRVSVREAK